MIWFKSLSISELNERGLNTFSDKLSIVFTKIGDDVLIATMPVTQDIKQPAGIVHGGAYVVLSETVASTAANAVINIETHLCVGLEINANHIRATREGLLTCKATALHIGRSTHVWQTEITNDESKLVSVGRMTASVIERRS